MPSAGKMVFADVIKDLNQGGPPTPTAGVLRGGSGDPETQTQRRQRRSHVAANPGAPGTRTARRGRRDPPQSPWWERARQPLENCEHVTFCGLKLLSSWCFPAAASRTLAGRSPCSAGRTATSSPGKLQGAERPGGAPAPKSRRAGNPAVPRRRQPGPESAGCGGRRSQRSATARSRCPHCSSNSHRPA